MTEFKGLSEERWAKVERDIVPAGWLRNKRNRGNAKTHYYAEDAYRSLCGLGVRPHWEAETPTFTATFCGSCQRIKGGA